MTRERRIHVGPSIAEAAYARDLRTPAPPENPEQRVGLTPRGNAIALVIELELARQAAEEAGHFTPNLSLDLEASHACSSSSSSS